ncbi:MAG: YfhO family protein [Anaerolineae bacterium]
MALVTIFLAPALRPGYTLLPLGLEAGIAPWNKQVYQQAQNLLLSDPFYQYYPFRNVIAESLRQGRFILWNPYVFSGHPMLGDVMTQTFYPPNLLGALLFPLARAWVFLIWGHMGMTGLLMYGYLRHLSLRPASALFGATIWMFNSVAVVWLEAPQFLSTSAWLPGIFWLLSIGKKHHRWSAIAGAGAMFGVLILAGQMQYAIGAAWLIGVWGTFHAAVQSAKQRRMVLLPLITVLVVGALGVGIGMIQLAPAIELIKLSHRAPLLTLLQTRWSLRHIITLWMPDFYGNSIRSPWWGDGNIAEMSGYFGLWPFVLSLCALAWCKRLDGRFWGGMIFIVLLSLWGTPIAYLLSWVPGIRYVRLTRLLYFIPLTGSMAAAFALDAAQDHLPQHPRRVWATLAIVTSLLVVASGVVIFPQFEQIVEHSKYLWPQVGTLISLLIIGLVGWGVVRKHPAWGTLLIVLVSCADLMAWGMPFNPVNSLDILYPENPITDWLRQDPGLYRVLPLQSDRVVFGPSVLSIFGFQEPGGYSSQIVRRYRDLAKAIQGRVDVWWMAPNTQMLVHSEFDPLFSMLNVKYVLSSYSRPERIIVEVASEGCLTDVPLRQEGLVTQEFQVANPGLNRVDLKFRPVENPGQATLRFWLWRNHIDGELIASIPFQAAEISTEGEKVFFFAPVTYSAGETFVWGVELTEAEEEPGLALCRAGDGQNIAFSAYSTQLRFADTIQGVWIYENPNVLPRAYVSHHVEAVTDEDALARIRNKEFDPWHSVMISVPMSPELQALAETPRWSSISPANVVEYSSHKVVVDVQTDSPGILVLSDNWYPGWYAKMDGQDADILRVNYALRGVYVDGGTHRVEFQFRPPSLHLGAAFTLGALLVVVFIAWLDWRHYGKCQERGKCEYLSHG